MKTLLIISALSGGIAIATGFVALNAACLSGHMLCAANACRREK